MNEISKNSEPMAPSDSPSPSAAMEIVAERFAQILWDYVMWERRMKREQAEERDTQLGGLFQ